MVDDAMPQTPLPSRHQHTPFLHPIRHRICIRMLADVVSLPRDGKCAEKIVSFSPHNLQPSPSI